MKDEIIRDARVISEYQFRVYLFTCLLVFFPHRATAITTFSGDVIQPFDFIRFYRCAARGTMGWQDRSFRWH